MKIRPIEIIKLLSFQVISVLSISTMVFSATDDPRITPIVKVVKENNQAVVNISTERIILLSEHPSWGNYGSEFDIFFKRFFDNIQPMRAVKLKSVGSGVILDKSGLIVTNAHVVNMASNIYVILYDGTSVNGMVVYEDVNDDLALIKVKPPYPLKKAILAQPGDIIIGETVVAIGNPLGLENSVTSGIISGKNRSVYSSRGKVVFDKLIQIDAPINPGNSGGALLNLKGELIGINVAVVQNSQNIGFAIPVEKVRKLLDSYNVNKKLVLHRKRKHPATMSLKPKNQIQHKTPIHNNRWDPLLEFSRVRRYMDQMVRDMFDKYNWQREMGGFESTLFYDRNFDTEETEDSYIIKLKIADLDKSNINIEINRSSITITGKRTEETKKKDRYTMYQSRRFGILSRTIPIPSDVDLGAIRTDIKDNTLIITLPKK